MLAGHNQVWSFLCRAMKPCLPLFPDSPRGLRVWCEPVGKVPQGARHLLGVAVAERGCQVVMPVVRQPDL
eukprot:scaffold82623_cov66-Phaeocystis_antarctica.AAC.2